MLAISPMRSRPAFTSPGLPTPWKFQSHLRRREGFTLPELLVALAIVAALAALVLPVFGKIRETSHSATCVSNLRQIGVGIQGFIAEHQHYPCGHQPEGNYRHENPDQYPVWDRHENWASMIGPYLSTTDDPVERARVFQCGSCTFPSDSPNLQHYSSHPRIFPAVDAEGVPKPGQGPITRPANLMRPAETLLIADAIQYDKGPTYAQLRDLRAAMLDGSETSKENPITGADLGPDEDFTNKGTRAANIRYRHAQTRGKHDGYANVLFADGHVAPVKYGELKEKNVRTNY